VVDLDRDGVLDLLSGSYQPGDVLLFAGRKEPRGLAAPRSLVDRAGEKLRVGRASWPQACDWDRDGDLDLVLGNMYGAVFLARNGSSSAKLELAPPVPLTVKGAEIKFDATNAAPHVADWDQDGAPDLLLGLSTGRVLFYRNTTTSGESVLDAPRELVPDLPEGVAAGTLARSGMRPRVAVVDWNGDGRFDLVVGEYAPRDGAPRELSAEEQAALAAAQRETVSVGQERGRLESAALRRWLAARGLSVDDGPAHYEEFLLEFVASAEARAVDDRLRALTATQRRLNPTQIDRGGLWVYLRAPAAAAATK
jgi:hypothetical protein